MNTIHDKAKALYETSGTIQPLLNLFTSMEEITVLLESIKGTRNPFTKVVRQEAKIFRPQLKRKLRFDRAVDTIDDFCGNLHSANGEQYHRWSRTIATGMIRELPPEWTGLVSENAILNVGDVENATMSTYTTNYLNSSEHFYNNMYAAAIVLCYMLHYEYDREVLEDICNVVRQVHITTAKENNLLKHNGQNEEEQIGWKAAYKKNGIILVDVGIKPVDVLSIKDVVPSELIDTTLKLRVEWKN